MIPDPPYPHVLANGWRFELNIERIKQGDTWTLTPPPMRNHLLRLWMEAWVQSPCGSLPDNDEIIAARIDVDRDTFAANRTFLMRGWVLHSDGRLYHKVLTELVERMRDGRANERNKKRKQRAATKDSPAVSPDVPGGHTGTVPVCPPTGTGTGTGSKEERGGGVGGSGGKPRKRGATPERKLLTDLGISVELADQWLEVRKKKRLTLTEVAIDGLKREVEHAGCTMVEAVTMAVEMSWGGFRASWYAREQGKPGAVGGTAFSRERSSQANEWKGSLGNRPDVIEMEGSGNA